MIRRIDRSQRDGTFILRNRARGGQIALHSQRRVFGQRIGRQSQITQRQVLRILDPHVDNVQGDVRFLRQFFSQLRRRFADHAARPKSVNT